ncbi:MAG TPA: EAL domain-containing protein [Candidatus Limnocylindrales bacterium]|nr:EAL domain-containing protein [Candidatus Limnocylindrales bacterium]
MSTLPADQPDTRDAPAGPVDRPAPVDRRRTDALRRIVASVNASADLRQLFEDVLDSSRTLFGASKAGLWLLHPGDRPFRLVAHRGLTSEFLGTVAGLRRDEPAVGLDAIREGRPIVLVDPVRQATAPALAASYAALGFRTVCFVPLRFRDEDVGLLVLYHEEPHEWSTHELDLVAAFADQTATAVVSARLFESVTRNADRLRAISELSIRLNRIQDVEGIGRAIVQGADRLIEHDLIRVYRLDHGSGMCLPMAVHGSRPGTLQLPPAAPPVRVGEGLTGWVAATGQALRIADATRDPRATAVDRPGGGPGSVLIVPMRYEDRVIGAIAVSAEGEDRYHEDDEATLGIFAGYAAQALVNAERFEQLEHKEQVLRQRLESQRRLLEINERLLSTLDPVGVLDMIADSLKHVVAYDTLTIYRVDREAGVRRAVVARDRFAELILQHEGPVDAGITGWAIQHGQSVLANDAHLDPRSIQIPGTPFEPESMIVCPLLVAGEVAGTLNIGRMGESEAHFSQDEFELVQLFAGQASIALRNAAAHGAVLTRAEQDALTGLGNHGAFQQRLHADASEGHPFAIVMLDLDGFKVYNDTRGHPAGDTLLVRVAAAMRAAVRDRDGVFRYGGDEFALLLPGADAGAARDVAERVRAAIAALTLAEDPQVTASAGIALFPTDGRTPGELVAAADRALYLSKPSVPGRTVDLLRDPYLAALDETAMALVERLDPTELLGAIVDRAAALMRTPHAYLYLLESSAAGDELVLRVGRGIFEAYVGYRLPRGMGLGWQVIETAHPVTVDEYDALATRAPDMPVHTFGAVVGVPMTSEGAVVGVIGLASGGGDRRFSEREVVAIGRFAQLASIALDNARLFERAQREVRERARAALRDGLTGLPNSDAFRDLVGVALDRAAGAARGRRGGVAVALLDLERFRTVNESLGHAAGDRLLALAASRISAAVRPTDTVARFGGDEFSLLLAPVRDRKDAERRLGPVVQALHQPFDVGGQEVSVSVCVGVAIGRPGTTTPEELLREAEIALHESQGDRVRRVVAFDPRMRTQVLDRIDLERDLRHAVERDELRLHYQPIVDLRSKRVLGYEALVRWQHPVRGLLGPASFIELAEEVGAISAIGDWVLRTACAQARAWRDPARAAPGDAAPTLSVNLSARQFAEGDLAARLRQILTETGLDAGALELEITESTVMDLSERGVERLRQLRDLGVRLVLDDFGTGYSSLAYLRRLPLDALKIDRSFVLELGGEAADAPIVQAVIDLAHGLGIEVVAEGIETAEQLAILRRLGCDRGQGFLFARPLPAADFAPGLAPARLTRVLDRAS